MLPKTILLTSLVMPSALAVSLADFSPRASNLSPQCQAVYTSTISACQPSDFQRQQCSRDCINALNALKVSVAKACRNVSGRNILVSILAGHGTTDLCPNGNNDSGDDNDQPTTTAAPIPAPAPTTSSAPPPPSSSTTTQPPQTTSQTQSQEQSSSTSQRTTMVVSTNTVMPVPSSTGGSESGVAIDTNTPDGVTSPTLSARPTSTSSAGNGGPFGQGLEPGVRAAAAPPRAEGVLLAVAMAAVVGVVATL